MPMPTHPAKNPASPFAQWIAAESARSHPNEDRTVSNVDARRSKACHMRMRFLR
jgi:hypothetical protein